MLLVVGCITLFRVALVYFEFLRILVQPKNLISVFHSYEISYHGVYIKETKQLCFLVQ